MESLTQDLRHALRALRRRPGFTVVAVLTLALGLGATIAIFGVVDAVLLRALPYPEPQQLVHVWETNPQGEDFTVSQPNYLDFRDQNRSLAALAAYQVGERSLTGAGEPERLRGVAATHSLFPMLGAAPRHGRTFGADEDRPGGERRVAMVSEALWRRRFGADPALVGRRITLDGEPHTVVGILPRDFGFLDADVWTPLAADDAGRRSDHWLGMVGRLRPGSSLQQAQADLAAVAARTGAAHPEVSGWGVRVLTLSDWLVEPRLRSMGALIFGAVALLLLMACANVANLLLARASARQAELGVRVALGASRARVIRQLLTESLVLSALGGTAGLLIASWAMTLLRALPDQLIPRVSEARIDGRLLAFTLAATVFTTVVFGLAPALQVSAGCVQDALRAGRSGPSRGQRRLREALVVSQVALAMLLLVGAGLMTRSLTRLRGVDTGFRTDNVWAVPLQLPGSRYDEEWKVAEAYRGMMGQIAGIPGVASVGAVNVDPLSSWNLVNDVTPVEKAGQVPESGYMQAAWRVVSDRYFEAAGVPLQRGRLFGEADRDDGKPVAVISRSLAERMWPGQDPIGKRFFWGGTDGTPRTVVGVVGDIRDVSLEADPPPLMFLSMRQLTWPGMTLLVRTDRPVQGLAAAVRRAVWSQDPNLPVPEVRPLRESRERAVVVPRLNAGVLGAFAAAAVLLAGIGLYGVLAFAVAERQREIGVRLALGAPTAHVMRMLVGRGLGLSALGVGLGLVAALGLTRFVQGLLYQTPGTDPLTYALVIALLGGVTLLACIIPGRRATRLDPMAVLRGD